MGLASVALAGFALQREATGVPAAVHDGPCEATDGARCWYVAADAPAAGQGSHASPFQRPQQAVDRARPGDFIYLRGGAEFTHDHAERYGFINVSGRVAVDGEPGRLITIKSYPGEQAVIRGRSVDGIPTENLGIRISRSYWRVEGLRIIHGVICVACNVVPNIEHVWIVGNHISDALASVGNFGMISISGQTTQGGPVREVDPRNIFIHHNVVHTLWGMQPGNVGPLPWYEDRDVEHHACLMIHRASGLVEMVGNEFSECASIFYSKFLGPGPTVARDNYFHSARSIAYRWRSSRPEFENNVFARFQRPEASFDITQGAPVEGLVFRRNTFHLGPWEMNPQGSRGAVGWNDQPHVFRDNVVYGPAYHARTPSRGSDIDGNCLVGDGTVTAGGPRSRPMMWNEYRSSLGHDRAGTHLPAAGARAVFRNTATGDFSLVGAAATACAGRGADQAAPPRVRAAMESP
jgi:hypothetical protein